MEIYIIRHAKERMQKYGITGKMVWEALESPDTVAEGNYSGKIYRKKTLGRQPEGKYEHSPNNRIVTYCPK